MEINKVCLFHYSIDFWIFTIIELCFKATTTLLGTFRDEVHEYKKVKLPCTV